jgi:hypothetical protein
MSNPITNCNVSVNVDWIETIPIVGGTLPFTHNEMDLSLQQLNSSSSPPISEGAVFNVTMSGTTATLNLTSLTGLPTNTVTDGSNGGGTSVASEAQIVVFSNTGSHPLTISNAGSNSYALFGATYSLTLLPGQYIFAYLNNSAPQVLSTQKNILLTGTNGDTYKILVLFGGT